MYEEKDIYNRETYLKYFTGSKELESNKNLYIIQEKALNYALDIRKFEIDLYWKRATYFWAFIAASFAGYFALISVEDLKYPSVIIIVCILGYLFSFSWYLVNRGSKFWQKNWEKHVDYLEDEIIGLLYRVVKNPTKPKFRYLLSEYPFSVSKINQLLSLCITIIWVVLTYLSSFRMFPEYGFLIFLIELTSIIAITLFYYYFVRSSLPGIEKIKAKKIETECKFRIRDLE
jgi:hypothetical protein